jgi:uncharacterized integral membrane protein
MTPEDIEFVRRLMDIQFNALIVIIAIMGAVVFGLLIWMSVEINRLQKRTDKIEEYRLPRIEEKLEQK